MNRYTSEQLAAYAKAFALNEFDNEDKIYERFKGDLGRRMKRVQLTVPLPEELERQSRLLATKAHEMLGYIKEEAIERKLSSGLKQEAWHPGVDLNSYQTYFSDLTVEMVKGAIAEAHRPLAVTFRDWKKKQRIRQ